jgi:LPXTG-motif cell wall-anchored protein
MKTAAIAALFTAGMLAAFVPQAKADQWNERTVFTFSAPVEIPGQVLSPGTYVFKLADSQSDRDIVEVYNQKEDHLYGTFLAVPDYRLRPAGRPIITFEERAAGAPAAVRAWFYPGDNYGHEFVYSKAKAAELAKTNNMPVASMPNNLAQNTTQPQPAVTQFQQAPLTAQQPSQQEEQITQAFQPPPQHVHRRAEVAQNQPPQPPVSQNNNAQPPASQNQPQSAAPQNQLPQNLPQTASSLPSIALLGLISLGMGGLLWGIRKQWN